VCVHDVGGHGGCASVCGCVCCGCTVDMEV
jgi:hypothetical protein